MLVLSRKEGERIIVGGNIEIIITEVSGNRVRVGVSAPSEIAIRRGELEELHSEFAPRERDLSFA